MTATHLPWAERTEDWELRLQLWANETIIHLVHYTTNKWHAVKGRGKGWRLPTFETYLPAHRTCNHPLCNHIRTWLDERVASNSRCVIEKGKRIVIIGLFQWCAAARRGGGMPTLTSASVWQCRRPLCWPDPLYTGTKPSTLLSEYNNKHWPWQPHSVCITCCCSVSCVVASQRHLPGEMPDVLYVGQSGCPFTSTW